MAPFRPRFFEESPLFWPIAGAASAFAAERDWPAVHDYARAFGERAPSVAFEEQPPAPSRRPKAAVEPSRLYDARIAREGRVPTRPRSWHDFLNALVWATFPRAKLALHVRQLRVLRERIEPGARTLPGTRSREHDALALVDEGGVVVLDEGRSETLVLFGHALYEGLVLGRGAATACAIRASHSGPPDRVARIARAEQVLAAHLETADLHPRTLDRVRIPAA